MQFGNTFVVLCALLRRKFTPTAVITRNTVKYVQALAQRKHREREGLFVAEGPKVVRDLLPLLPCARLFATEEFLRELDEAEGEDDVLRDESDMLVERVTQAELERLSLLRTPRGALGLFRPRAVETRPEALAAIAKERLCLALDTVQDPGNLGTIVRVADWFGIEHIFASPGTADVYAPKVVQATMGAVGRVAVHYVDLPELLRHVSPDVPVYGTFLDGQPIDEATLSPRGIIVMGNEGSGISPDVARAVTRRLFIPPYPAGRPTSESLNVAVATAIVCAKFRAHA